MPAATISRGSFLKLIELVQAGSRGREYGNQDGPDTLGNMITVGLRDLVDDPGGVLRRKSIRSLRSDFFEPIFMVESAENGGASNTVSLGNAMPMSALLRGRT